MMSINFSGQWGQKLYEVKFEILFTRVSKNGLKIEILGQNSDLNMSRILHTFLKKTFSCLAIRALCIPIFNFLPGKAAERIGNLQEREQNYAHIRTRILIKKATEVTYMYIMFLLFETLSANSKSFWPHFVLCCAFCRFDKKLD